MQIIYTNRSTQVLRTPKRERPKSLTTRQIARRELRQVYGDQPLNSAVLVGKDCTGAVRKIASKPKST